MNIKGLLGLTLYLFVPLAVGDELPTFKVAIEEHRFQPSEITIPAGHKVKLLVRNKDSIPEEFESDELRREKVILAGQQAVITVGPLKPGRYPFFGEFHQDTAQGVVIAE